MLGTGIAGGGRGSGGGSGGGNDGEFVIGREERVIIAIVVGVNDGKMPVVGSAGVTPTFEDGGPSLVDCLDIMFGEDDS